MKYARKMTKRETIAVVDWLRANILVLHGLTYREVGELVISEKVIGREELTKDQVAAIARDWGIEWEKPKVVKSGLIHCSGDSDVDIKFDNGTSCTVHRTPASDPETVVFFPDGAVIVSSEYGLFITLPAKDRPIKIQTSDGSSGELRISSDHARVWRQFVDRELILGPTDDQSEEK